MPPPPQTAKLPNNSDFRVPAAVSSTHQLGGLQTEHQGFGLKHSGDWEGGSPPPTTSPPLPTGEGLGNSLGTGGRRALWRCLPSLS